MEGDLGVISALTPADNNSMSPAETQAVGSARTSRLRRITGTQKVWLLSAALLVTAIALLFEYVAPLRPIAAPVRVPWWALAMMFACAEVWVVHLQFRRDAHSFSLSEIPLVLGLFFSTPLDLVFGQFLGAMIALSLIRRQSPTKIFFNVSHFGLEVCLAVLIFRSFGVETTPLEPTAWLAATLGTLVATSLGVFAIAFAISFSEGGSELTTLREAFAPGVAVTITNTSLALIAVAMLWFNPAAAWLLLVPAVILFFAYRLYTAERQKHESLEFLYESTRVAHRTLQTESVVMGLLNQACKMFRAEAAEMVLFDPEDNDVVARTSRGPGNEITMLEEDDVTEIEREWMKRVTEGEALLVRRHEVEGPIRAFLDHEDIKDLMAAPLHGDEGVVGMMVVKNRLGEVSTFDGEDLKLFLTLANHASVSLENARLVSRLEESLAHLTEMNRLKDDFVAAVSHELRTPLTSIQGYVKTLLRAKDRFGPEEQHSFLETIDQQSNRLRQLIEDLLAVSRLESQRDQLALTEISLAKLAGRVVDELRARAGDHDLDVRLNRSLPRVHTDEGKVHQLLSNLIENALKYSPPGTTVTVDGVVEQEGVTISVIDQGEGVPPELHEKIFDRFFQVDQSSTRKVGGTGLGLYICRRLAESIDARVWLKSSTTSGSEFCLWLPLHPSAKIVERSMDLRPIESNAPGEKDRSRVLAHFS
jgi:signal transduction histidine kinase